MAITIIFGNPGVGKTALMTKFALEKMRGYEARQGLKALNTTLAQLDLNGFNLPLPNTPHLVFSDYFISADRRGLITNNEINGFRLGLPNKNHTTLFIPPYSQIYLDEAQKYLNSRKRLATYISRFYEMHRHFSMNITLAAQRPALIVILHFAHLNYTVGKLSNV